MKRNKIKDARRVAPADNRNPLADHTDPDTASALTPLARRFVLHWGEMGSRWGVNRTVAQIHALLFYFGRPMNADEIGEILGVARSNISTSLRELQSWRLVRVTHLLGDRRDHFETASDVWDLFQVIVRERKAREFDPTVAALRSFVGDPALEGEPAASQARLRTTLAMMQSLSDWADQMLSLSPATLTKLMKLGAKVQSLLRS